MSYYPDDVFDPNDGEGLPSFPGIPEEQLERMRKRVEESRNRSMNEAREWPPPDSTVKQWKAYGMKCAIARGSALCGYVHVPADHPDANRFYDDVDVEVHGGLTFRCKAEDGGAWFGFDCSHLDDWVGFGNATVVDEDGVDALVVEQPGRIWTVEDVEEETKRLAEQFELRGRRGSDG
jgi:hypothetical protein